MKKPNYSMERKDRERAKQAKAAAREEKRAGRADESRQPAIAADEAADPVEAGKPKPGG